MGRKTMRILFLTSNLPYPLMAGHLRYFHFMRELSERHDITLLSLTGKSFEPEHVRAFAGIAERVSTFPRCDEKAPLGRFLKEDVRLFYNIEPAMRRLRAAAEELARARRVDVAVLCGKRVLAAARPLRIPLVADVCDAESVRVRARMRCARPLELPRLALGWSLLHSMEQAVSRRVDRMLFASPRDRDAVVDRHDARAAVVPNGVDSEYWKRQSGERGRATIVFTGAMHYRPNADAALLLAREVFPLVRRKVPDARLFLVGRDPSDELKAAADPPSIIVTGLVEDVRPYLEEATVFVAPLRFASGIQNKILEAMSMELPVITMPAAADGLEAGGTSPAALTVRNSVEEIAEAVVRALQEESRAPSEEARHHVLRHFSWRTHAQSVEAVLQSAVESYSRRAQSHHLRAAPLT
jgi:glycosyltransferase involved in cell wall biosynthesis